MTETDLHPELRPLLFSIAYRMIGSVSEAEDIVQEAFLRYHRAQPGDVASPKAYLSAVTTRLAIDHLRSARVRREEYVGPWLPEPLLTDEGAGDPSARAELADSLSLAFLVLLERLSPVERAAFLLREVFAYPYDEIAEAEDVYTYTDGGGKAQAPRRTVHGREHVARFMAGIARPDRGAPVATLHAVLVNGVPGRLARDAEGNAVAVLTLDVADGLVTAVRIVVNPDKLAHLQAP